MDRIAYIFRRLLLVIPTFIGITIVCFSLTRFLPGGPVEIRMRIMRISTGPPGRKRVSEKHTIVIPMKVGITSSSRLKIYAMRSMKN